MPRYLSFLSISLLLTITCQNISYADTEWKLLGPGDADQVTSLNVLKNEDVFVGIDIGGVYKSTNRGDSWEPRNKGLNNFDITTKVIQDPTSPNTLFVGTRGGLYKSNDYGNNWSRKSNGLPDIKKYTLSGSIGAILLDPFDNKVLYTALGYRPSSDGTTTVKKINWVKHIYKSTDGGESWNKFIAFPTPSKVTQLQHSPSRKNTLYASTSTGLYISENAGKKWKQLLNRETLTIAIDPEAPDTIYAACNEDGIYKTTNHGTSWQDINDSLSFFDIRSRFTNRYSVILIDPKNNQRIYALNSTWGRAGGLYRSDNSGKSWTLFSKKMPESWLSTSSRMNDLALSLKDPDQIYMGSSRYIYASEDAGVTWEQKISQKIDNGWTHRGINVFGQTRVISVDHNDENTIYIGTADHKIVKSSNRGTSWNLLLHDDKDANYVWDINICHDTKSTVNIIASPNNKNLCYMKSNDKGASWEKNCSFSEKSKWKEKIRVAPDNCNNLLISTYNNLYKSTDQGDTWDKIDIGVKNIKIFSIEYDPNNSNTYYIGTNKGLYSSYDAGKNWKLISGTRNLTVTSIYKQLGLKNELFIGTQLSNKRPAELYKSTDNGHTWKKVIANLRRYVSAITSLPANQNILYASTLDDNYHDESMGAGIYKSTDRGETWHRIDHSLPVHKAYGISTSPSSPTSVYLATNGSGAYVADDENASSTDNQQSE